MASISTRSPSPGSPATCTVVRAGRWSPNDARVDAVHLRELAHVEQEDAAPQHVLQAGPGRLEDGLDVFQALLGLLLDIVRDAAGRRIGAALPGDEDEPLESHSG